MPLNLRDTYMGLGSDFRVAARVLLKTPAFTLIAVSTLALGIAANTTVFSLLDAVLLRQPSIREPQSVVLVLASNQERGLDYSPVSPQDFLEWQQNTSFTGLAGALLEDVALTGGKAPQRVSGMRVSANYFDLLGVSASFGRTFLAGEDIAGKDRVAILSDGLWRDRFGGARDILDRHVRIQGEDYKVAGVMPPGFVLPLFHVQLWMPLTVQSGAGTRNSRSLYLFGRLKDGVTVKSARAQMGAFAKRSGELRPGTNAGWSATVIELQNYVLAIAQVMPAVVSLMGAALVVLLIGCTNLASLLLARRTARAREIAVRVALGCSRLRLARQLLCESIVLGVLGCALGFLLTHWGVKLLSAAFTFNAYTRSVGITIDARVIWFGIAVSALATILFGLSPLFGALKMDGDRAIGRGQRGAGTSRGTARARNALVAVELGLALVLLVLASGMIVRFRQAMRSSLSFRTDDLLTGEVSLLDLKYEGSARRAAFVNELLGRLSALPGVLSASVTTQLPLLEAPRIWFDDKGQPVERQADQKLARYRAVSPGYFKTLQVPLVMGRDFDGNDGSSALPVAIVNQALARRFFNGNALERYITLQNGDDGPPKKCRIVGVVGNVKEWIGQPADSPQIYEPYAQAPSNSPILAVRSDGHALPLARGVRESVWSIDKNQPVEGLRSMSQVVAEAGAGDILLDDILTSFASLALVISLVGIYGVVNYIVSMRSKEMGIRMAIGARRSDVFREILRRALALIAFGCIGGAMVAYPLARVVLGSFPGEAGQVLKIVVEIAAMQALVALIACYVPARRASRLDPMTILRDE